MAYIIKKTDVTDDRSRRFVAPSGSHNSYTASKEKAKKFDSYEEALADCCGNETPIKVY